MNACRAPRGTVASEDAHPAAVAGAARLLAGGAWVTGAASASASGLLPRRPRLACRGLSARGLAPGASALSGHAGSAGRRRPSEAARACASGRVARGARRASAGAALSRCTRGSTEQPAVVGGSAARHEQSQRAREECPPPHGTVSVSQAAR